MGVICDAIFRLTLVVCFRWRGKGQAQNVKMLLDVMGERKRELSMHSLIASSDRGYGSMALLETFLQH